MSTVWSFQSIFQIVLPLPETPVHANIISSYAAKTMLPVSSTLMEVSFSQPSLLLLMYQVLCEEQQLV